MAGGCLGVAVARPRRGVRRDRGAGASVPTLHPTLRRTALQRPRVVIPKRFIASRWHDRQRVHVSRALAESAATDPDDVRAGTLMKLMIAVRATVLRDGLPRETPVAGLAPLPALSWPCLAMTIVCCAVLTMAVKAWLLRRRWI